jgi:hypothetical protein
MNAFANAKMRAIKRRFDVTIGWAQPMKLEVEVEAYSAAQAIHVAWHYRRDHSYLMDEAGYDWAEAIEIEAAAPSRSNDTPAAQGEALRPGAGAAAAPENAPVRPGDAVAGHPAGDRGSVERLPDRRAAVTQAMVTAKGAEQPRPRTTGIVKSISADEDEILLGIMNLHNGGRPFDADVTFSVGGLYRGSVPEPRLKFDIAPQRDDVQQADVRCLPLARASISSVVFDPPFMFAPHGTARTKNAAAGRYSMFEAWHDLVCVYRGALREFRRVLRKGGIVAFKTQDYTDTSTTMTHCLVYQWAIDEGFYAKDLFIRYRLFGPAWNPDLRQKHARKFHSYWFVLEKIS